MTTLSMWYLRYLTKRIAGYIFGYTKEVAEVNQTHRGYIFGYTKLVHEVNQTHRGYIFGYTKEIH